MRGELQATLSDKSLDLFSQAETVSHYFIVLHSFLLSLLLLVSWNILVSHMFSLIAKPPIFPTQEEELGSSNWEEV